MTERVLDERESVGWEELGLAWLGVILPLYTYILLTSIHTYSIFNHPAGLRESEKVQQDAFT